MRKIIVILFFTILTVAASAQNKKDVNLILIRYENEAIMNIIPCRIYIKSRDNVLIKIENIQVYDLGNSAQSDRIKKQYFMLIGGDKADLILGPGEYTIDVVTPVSEQRNYLAEHQHDWISVSYKMKITDKKKTTLYITPARMDSGYSGGWDIGTSIPAK